MLSLSTLDIATEDTKLQQSQGSLCCPLLRMTLQLGDELQMTESLNCPFEATFVQMEKHHMRWHQKQCQPSATLKEDPSCGCWKDLAEHLSGHLLGSISCAGTTKWCGQRNGWHLYLSSVSTLCWTQPCSLRSPQKTENHSSCHRDRHINSFSKASNQLWLFYLYRRMKAVFCA